MVCAKDLVTLDKSSIWRSVIYWVTMQAGARGALARNQAPQSIGEERIALADFHGFRGRPRPDLGSVMFILRR